jgi:hypothetical protein
VINLKDGLEIHLLFGGLEILEIHLLFGGHPEIILCSGNPGNHLLFHGDAFGGRSRIAGSSAMV